MLARIGNKTLARIGQSVLLGSLATAAVFLASRSTAFSDLNQWTYDFAVDHAALKPPAKDIVLVDFDDDTFNRIRRFPIPRPIIADVLNKISAQKPRVIGMDIFLSEPRGEEEDRQLQAALTKAQVVIIASQQGAGTLPGVMPLPEFCQPEDLNVTSGFCKDGTPGALGYAFVNMPTDADGFIRQANLLVQSNPPSLSFPVVLAQQYSGQTLQPVDAYHASFLGHTFTYADPRYKTFLIGSWSREPAIKIPAWKLMEGSVPPGAFTDKLVLIGESSDAARDYHFTPIFRLAGADSSRLRMLGTQVHAAAVRSLLEGSIIRPLPVQIDWLLVLLLCCECSLAFFSLDLGYALLLAAGAILLVAVASLLLFARAHLWLPFLPIQFAMAIAAPFTVGLRYIEERVVARQANEQRLRLMTLFSSYVDPAVANAIWARKDELTLAGEERTATVLFTDIRSFTALSAGQPPAKVLGWLNLYLTAMDEVIRHYDGFLNKFIGDGLMIIFGLPLSRGVEADAKRAMLASVAMLDRVRLLNEQHASDLEFPQLRIGVGMHTGPLMAGSIGSANRQEYSVIGETVNLASRLESLNKQYKTELLMSEATYNLLRVDFTGLTPLGGAKVAGFENPVPIYTLALHASEEPQQSAQESPVVVTQTPQ